MLHINSLLSNYKSGFNELIPTEKRITTINYSHPLYNNGVFEKQVSNFQYPKVNAYYNTTSTVSSAILNLRMTNRFYFKMVTLLYLLQQ